MSSPSRLTSHDSGTGFSDRQPNQLITWWEHNFTGSGDSGHGGEWLRCLKATRAGDRQLVWSGGAIAAIVTFAGWIRGEDRLIEGWGGITRLAVPVTREQLLSDARAAWRFDPRGIKALQGLPIRIDELLARAILENAGGIGATHVPLVEPDYSEEPILWAGPHGLEPESVIEAAVASSRSLWRRFGFRPRPGDRSGSVQQDAPTCCTKTSAASASGWRASLPWSNSSATSITWSAYTAVRGQSSVACCSSAPRTQITL